MLKYTNEYFLDDMKKRDMGVIFGKDNAAKVKALEFKEYAKENGLVFHVILDERKNWYVVSERHFNSVNKSWEKWNLPPLKSY